MTKRKPLPLTALRAFEAAARLGRMIAAADELAVTHGAVSRQVRQLEDYLGRELFEGPRNRPVLTAAGKRLVGPLTSALDQIDDAVRGVMHDSDSVVDVACFSTFAMRWLIPRLHRFQTVHPTIEVRLSTDDRGTRVPRGRYDVVVAALDPDAKTMAADIVLFRERLGVVLAPARMPRSGILRLSGLIQLPRLTTRTRENAWPLWLEVMGARASALSSAKPAVEYEHYSFAIEAAANGLGACVAPFHLVADDLLNGRLVAPLDFVDSGYRYVARLKQPRPASALHFVEWLRREAKPM
jgi:LysR family transcriptional regulator, glycine cleavage system transcriptional activator